MKINKDFFKVHRTLIIWTYALTFLAIFVGSFLVYLNRYLANPISILVLFPIAFAAALPIAAGIVAVLTRISEAPQKVTLSKGDRANVEKNLTAGLSFGHANQVQRFLREYLGDEDESVPFGGRRKELADLTAWLENENRSPCINMLVIQHKLVYNES